MNDFLIAGNSVNNINTLKAIFNNKFKISDLGVCHFYFDMEMIWNRLRRQLKLFQIAYLEKVLRDHGMKNYNGIITFMETSSRLMPAEPEYFANIIFHQKYQSVIGFLIYTILSIWLNFAFVISVISRFFSNPTQAHMAVMKRIFKYLKKTLYMGLVFRGFL
jgi:hypothetical protein